VKVSTFIFVFNTENQMYMMV